MSVDESAVDRLAALFAECRDEGIIVQDLPLDTPVRQRLAVLHLESVLYLARERKRRGGDAPWTT